MHGVGFLSAPRNLWAVISYDNLRPNMWENAQNDSYWMYETRRTDTEIEFTGQLQNVRYTVPSYLGQIHLSKTGEVWWVNESKPIPE